jgi:hypothetical protein
MTEGRPDFRLECSDEDKHASFYWQWADLPRKQLAGHPSQFSGFTLELNGGRIISLISMEQYLIDYPVALTPSISHPERHVLAAIQKAKRVAMWIEAAPIVLPPTLLEIDYSRDKQLSHHEVEPNLGPGENALVLPRVGVISEFLSLAAARDKAEVYSSLLVVWFQDSFGEIPATIQGQLIEIDWKHAAYDWTP